MNDARICDTLVAEFPIPFCKSGRYIDTTLTLIATVNLHPGPFHSHTRLSPPRHHPMPILYSVIRN